jgi:two-component system sensor histidine kinase KdpD
MNGNDEYRIDPDKLLESIKKDEEKSRKGKLKIFFGMCAGVGKTYSMLQSAHKAKSDGVDIVTGIVETHKRKETEALAQGLETIPLLEIEYRGSRFYEMNIDAILKRRPNTVCVDELAHSNIPGSRHVKRFQDVLELLNNGINVFTTLNVQHLESRSDTVTQITGARIRETVPDSVFENADDIELVDITIDELLDRLSEGKIYLPDKSEQAKNNFFRKGNLTALREMSLRLTAERVDYQLRNYRIDKDISATWKTGQRLMVAISPSPYSYELIRWTKRLAYTMEAPWVAVYVDTDPVIYEKNKEVLKRNFDLAEELGAEVIVTKDASIEKALTRIATENNITQIILGKSQKKGVFNRKQLLNKLLKESGSIDVYIVGNEQHETRKPFSELISLAGSEKYQYFISFLIITACSGALYFLQDNIGYQTVSLALLFVILLMPLINMGRGPIILAALLSALSWDYFFIPPKYTFHIASLQDILTFIMFFFVAIVNGVLTSKIKMHERFVRNREGRTNALYMLTKQLTNATGITNVAEIAVRNIYKYLGLKAMIIFGIDSDKLRPSPHPVSSFMLNDREWNIAQWCYLNSQKAGKFTNTLPQTDIQFIPLIGSRSTIGIIGVKFTKDEPLGFDSSTLLEAFVSQITTSAERELLNKIAKKSLLIAESEKLYKTLFSSLSHELKTPITAIMGAVSALLGDSDNKELRNNLSSEIRIAAGRLNRLVENLLDMTRLESGKLKIKLEWNDLSDLIDGVLERLQNESVNHVVVKECQPGAHLYKFDFPLIEQALINIVHNCLIYTPPKSEVKIEAHNDERDFYIVVTDNGGGFKEDEAQKIFDKFYRIPGTKTGGTGLGLSIAKGFIEAHNGSVNAVNNNEKGAKFVIRIPIIK